MKYRIRHLTEYRYTKPVSHCYNRTHLVPRASIRQKCLNAEIQISPQTAFCARRQDYFGNQSYHFEIQQPHDHLSIEAISQVHCQAQQPVAYPQLSCAESRHLLESSRQEDMLLAREFLLDSPMIPSSQALRDYAQASFDPHKSLLSAVKELTERIYQDFTYCPESTTVTTPLCELLSHKRGVCQDFAHMQIGCLRSMGFPAKYVSGYIENAPSPGEKKLLGADASHAWISVFFPQSGWIEFDPTNNCLAGEQHIITAWGRDYRDVTPVRGVIFGGGDNPALHVAVEVTQLVG